jgi:L-ascorbate metabolism protein UlaG (beta-lactamase superfamily)
VPPGPIDVLAVPVDGPWLKLAEAVDYVHAVTPRVAVPMHEGETVDVAKYTGMLAEFAPSGVVRRLPRGEATAT